MENINQELAASKVLLCTGLKDFRYYNHFTANNVQLFKLH